MTRKSPQRDRITGQKNRLDSLQKRIEHEIDPGKREPLYEQFANLAANCHPEVFTPTEISDIVQYSDLADQDALRNIVDYLYSGSRPDFLPIHHHLKLLTKSIESDKYIYLLGSTSSENITDISLRNARALEYFLLSFSNRLFPGHFLDLEIEGRKIQVPSHDERYLNDSSGVVKTMRQQLKQKGVDISPEYHLRRIKDGTHRIDTHLYILTEERILQQQGEQPEHVLISYLTNKPSI